jgi:hypothetical protein
MSAIGYDEANAAFDVIEQECGAHPALRDDFVRYAVREKASSFGIEFRFQGHLGFGGKIHRNSNRNALFYVDYYPEDKTPERDAMQDNANTRLAEIPVGRNQ